MVSLSVAALPCWIQVVAAFLRPKLGDGATAHTLVDYDVDYSHCKDLSNPHEYVTCMNSTITVLNAWESFTTLKTSSSGNPMFLKEAERWAETYMADDIEVLLLWASHLPYVGKETFLILMKALQLGGEFAVADSRTQSIELSWDKKTLKAKITSRATAVILNETRVPYTAYSTFLMEENKIVNYVDGMDFGTWFGTMLTEPFGCLDIQTICGPGRCQAEVCPGEDAFPFQDVLTCNRLWKKMPVKCFGKSGYYGNSQTCRQWHGSIARVDPTTHCSHMGLHSDSKCRHDQYDCEVYCMNRQCTRFALCEEDPKTWEMICDESLSIKLVSAILRSLGTIRRTLKTSTGFDTMLRAD